LESAAAAYSDTNDARIPGPEIPYHCVREPLTAEESDRLFNTCMTPGFRVSELCSLTSKNALWQQSQLRVKGKGGPYGSKTEVRVVPMSNRVRALLEHDFANR
jgi:integrase/recombinase XerD